MGLGERPQMFWRIRKAWRLLLGRCPACNDPLSTLWATGTYLHLIEYCPKRHFVCFDNDPELEFEDEDADIEMTKVGL